MRRTLRLLALPLACAAVGCVDRNQSLMITDFLAIDGSMMCQVATSQNLLVSGGFYDVGLSRLLSSKLGYIAAPRVQNNLVPTGSAGQIERGFITVNAFEVELRDQQGNFLPAPNDHPYSVVSAVGLVTPGGGRATAMVELIPSASLEAAFAQAGPGFNSVVVATVRAIGDQGGTDVQSGWFKFPVTVCDGCLAPSPQTACPVGGFESSTILKGGCFITQDVPITCCTSSGIICGDHVPVKASMNAGNDAGT